MKYIHILETLQGRKRVLQDSRPIESYKSHWMHLGFKYIYKEQIVTKDKTYYIYERSDNH